jgi:hypothetical protein
LWIEVLAQSNLHDEVFPLLLTTLVGGRSVWRAHCFGDEPPLHFTEAGFANAEEVAGLVGFAV